MKRQKIRKALLLISFLLFPITIYYLSPYLIIQGAFEGIVAGSFILFCLIFLVSLFMGRTFCGWFCPAGGLQECCTMSVNKPIKSEKANVIKFIIWVPWIIAIVLGFVAANGIHKIDPLYSTVNGISVSEPSAYIIYYGVLILILALAYTAGRRSFCHYVCWMAPFMIISVKIKNVLGIPSLHLRATSSGCIDCKLCNKACAMSLDVNKMVKNSCMNNSECILCGECIDVCPKSVIKYSFGSSKKKVQK